MEHKTLLSVLSPQLQSLVEASLGEKLQIRQSPVACTTSESTAPVQVATIKKPSDTVDATASSSPSTQHHGSSSPPNNVKLNPSELFVLRHAESPGFVIKNNFLGPKDALSVRTALLTLAETAEFHQAAVGNGDNKREEVAVRGDRIHWIQRPPDLKNATTLDAAILLLMRKVESLVFGIKNGIPALNLRNVTSTQLAIFPGDGARFVKHTDTYATAHLKGRSDTDAGTNELVRLVTCVYYLNPDWTPEHGGSLRVFTKDSPPQHWDVPPALDTLVVFRSTDVEHEVLPTYQERMALTIWYYGPRPTPPASSKWTPSTSIARSLPTIASLLTASPPSQDTIFVAIPSYRDSECCHTIDDLLQRARTPSRVIIGICLQCDDDDDTQTYLETKYGSHQVRSTRVDYREAAGPCVARALAQKLYENETFYLQIDSHMRFRDGWDDFFISELRKCPSPKPILTTYPLGYTLPNELSDDERPALLCASNFDEHGMLRQSSKTLARKADAPMPSLFWAAGFAFSSGRVVTEVPYDASLRFLFFGEEASMSARLWTHGWDFFAPSEMAIYHLWTRAYRPVFQELESEDTKTQRQQSVEAVKTQLEAGDGLGSERTLVAYQRHIGVDFASRTIEWQAEWGGVDPIQFDLSVVKERV